MRATRCKTRFFPLSPRRCFEKKRVFAPSLRAMFGYRWSPMAVAAAERMREAALRAERRRVKAFDA